MIVGFFYQNVFSLVKVSILNASTLFVDLKGLLCLMIVLKLLE